MGGGCSCRAGGLLLPLPLECTHLTSAITLWSLENSAHHPPSHHNISGRHLKDERCLPGRLAHPSGEQRLPPGGGAANPALISSLPSFFFPPFLFPREVKLLICRQRRGVATSTVYGARGLFDSFMMFAR